MEIRLLVEAPDGKKKITHTHTHKKTVASDEDTQMRQVMLRPVHLQKTQDQI